METKHLITTCDSSDARQFIQDQTVALVVTSPPYPMIAMWDGCFSRQSDTVQSALCAMKYEAAFEGMHQVLDRTWDDVDRVLMDGGLVCINIGDATRNCGGRFKLFSNHTRVINRFLQMGYDLLPDIHWHKPTNAPNKFMGSGMYPPCAYVTYEHEYILIFRKGSNREFHRREKVIRHNSSYFWEERNIWFSDLWELNGTAQNMVPAASRKRSAAFPFELPYRLVNMFSIKGDLVYDPFSGTGTTVAACAASERNSVGIDTDEELCKQAIENILRSKDRLNARISNRIARHREFVASLSEVERGKLYQNDHHAFPVKTRQELELQFRFLSTLEMHDGKIICGYKKADV